MPEITPDLRFTVKLTTEEFRLIAASLAKSDDPHAVALGDSLQRIRGALTANLSKQGERLVRNVDRGGPARRGTGNLASMSLGEAMRETEFPEE